MTKKERARRDKLEQSYRAGMVEHLRIINECEAAITEERSKPVPDDAKIDRLSTTIFAGKKFIETYLQLINDL